MRPEGHAPIPASVCLLLWVLIGAVGIVAADDDRPDIHLIVVDTLRADHVGAWGYQREVTPNLDRLAGQSLVFWQAVSSAPYTPSATASILTGLYPMVHGIRTVRADMEVGVEVMRPGVRTIAMELGRLGYQTMGVAGNPWIRKERGYARGFDRFVEVSDGQSLQREVNRLAVGLWKERDGRPLFMYLHVMDVHAPYERGWNVHPSVGELGPMPDEYVREIDHPERIHNATGWNGERRLERIVDAYDTGIRGWDDAFGEYLVLIGREKLLESVVVVVVSDHGEEFEDHGRWSHGQSLYEELIHVPLVVYAPAAGIRGVRDETVCTVQIMPTLLALATGEDRAGSLLRWAGNQTCFAEVETDAEAGPLRPMHFQYVARTGKDKAYHQGGKTRIYDLNCDPKERHPRRVSGTMVEEELWKWRTECQSLAGTLGYGDAVELSESVVERLKALGYGR